MASLLVGVLDELGIGSAALVGFSWGASICCHVAARHPTRVRSIVLLEEGHLDFRDLRHFDASEVDARRDVASAMARGLLDEPVTATYATLRTSAVPVMLVTALRDEAVSQLHVDPLRRLREEVPQAAIVRIEAAGHDLLADDDGIVAAIVRERRDAQ